MWKASDCKPSSKNSGHQATTKINSQKNKTRSPVLASLGDGRLDLADLGAHPSRHHAGQTGTVGDRGAGEELGMGGRVFR